MPERPTALSRNQKLWRTTKASSMTECPGKSAEKRHVAALFGPRLTSVSTTSTNERLSSHCAQSITPTHAMSTSTTKARHYAALGGRIRSLNSTMAETEAMMGQLTDHLVHMQQFAACHAAQ